MFTKCKYADLSLFDISKYLYDILYEKDIKEFNDWNISKNNQKNNTKQQTAFTSAFSQQEPADDVFIDLGALLQNICISIRDDRRKNDAFDKKFDEYWEQHKKELKAKGIEVND